MSQHGHSETSYNGVNADVIDKFLLSVFNLTLNEVLKKGRGREEPVVRFKKPDKLKELLSLELEDRPQNHETLLKHCADVIKYSVKTGHPHFFNQLYAGLDVYGFAGQIVTDALNTSIYTYEVAPVFTLIEQEILNHFCKIIGYGQGDGTFAPGGSYSNMLGMNLARFYQFPEVKEKGLHGLPRLVAFVSEHSHYSARKNGSLLGIGSDNVVAVECDEQGKMKPENLDFRINEVKKQNGVPFMVVATSGTTVFGAYDPLIPISDICKKYGLWLHVDAAWGGGVLLSKKHKHLCDGIERSDSVAWNPHKMAMAPLQCCIFVTKHLNILKSCHTISVPYLFQLDKKSYDPSYDVGSKVVQCGRKVDALKLWLMWKALGNDGMNARIDKAYENSRYLADLVRKTEGFKLVSEPEATNVCFWFIPENMRNLKWDLSDHEFCRKLSAVAPLIKEKMAERGTTLIGYQPLGKLPNFFRMIVISDDVNHDDMNFVVKEITDIGKDLSFQCS